MNEATVERGIICPAWDLVRVSKWETGKYREEGWEPYTPPANLTLPKPGFLKSWMRRRPETVTQLGAESLVGRWVDHVQWDLGAGSGGNMNFIGLQLLPSGNRPQEWLVLAIRNSGEYLICDGRRVAEPPGTVSKHKPVIHDKDDEMNPRFARTTIQMFSMKEKSCRLGVNLNGKLNALEFPDTCARLSPLAGGIPRPHLGMNELLSDAWVVSREGILVSEE